jgi:hypothetical protein
VYQISRCQMPKQPVKQLVVPEAIEPIDVFPATGDDIYWIANEEKNVYGKNPIDVMPYKLINSWYRKNPTCFWIIKRLGGEILGNLYLLPLKPKALDKLINGKICERDIRSEDIYSEKESDKITSLHITSLVCPKYSEGTVQFIRNFNQIIKNICNTNKLSYISALSASIEGKNLLERNGFTLVNDGKEREDQHPCYSIKYEDLVTRLKHRLSKKTTHR